MLLSGCASKSSHNGNDHDSVTFIFNNPVEQAAYTFSSGFRAGSTTPDYFSFVNTAGVLQDYRPKGIADTLTIPANGQRYIEVLHRYRVLEDIGLLVRVGDTVTVDYNSSGYPVLKSGISETLNSGYNLKMSRRIGEKYFGLDPAAIYCNYFFIRLDNAKRKGEAIPSSLRKDYINFDYLRRDIIASRKVQKRVLDSLIKIGQVEPVYGRYNAYEEKVEQIKLERSDRFFSYDSVTYRHIDSMFVKFFNDTLTPYPSYHRALNAFIVHQTSEEGVGVIASENGSDFDYRQVFENVKKRSDIPPRTRVLILYYLLDEIIGTFGSGDTKTYLGKFLSETGDTAKYKYIIKKYNINFASSGELQLRGIKGDVTNLSAAIRKHHGRVVYVDFWASWCNPCLRAMPYAKQLRTELVGKDVVFIYLALNDKEITWKSAIGKHNLSTGCDNYLIMNSKSADFIDEQKITTIPRYMLFDKTGRLVNANAPGPEGKAIRDEINKLLR